MQKSILVLEESQMVHDLFDSALPDDLISWKIDHETNPDNYLRKAKDVAPDLILLSNRDQKSQYSIARKLKSTADTNKTPILLLTSAKDKLDKSLLQSIGIKGFVRKPFEMATLQKQVETILEEQELAKRKQSKNELKDLNIIDDDLMDLMAGQVNGKVSIDDLEGELDPTLHLIQEDQDLNDEMAETELVAMDDSEEIADAEFIDNDIELEEDLMEVEDIDDDLDLEMEDLEDGLEDEMDELDTASDYLESDIADEYEFEDLEESSFESESTEGPITTISLHEAANATQQISLRNEPENSSDLGFMELTVVPMRRDKIQTSVVETIDDEFDEEKFVQDHSPAELEPDFDPEMEGTLLLEDDEIEIPHEEIIEDFYEGDEDEGDEPLDLEPTLEISVEGFGDNEDEDNPFIEIDEEEASSYDMEKDSDDEELQFEELDGGDELLEEVDIQEVELPQADALEEDAAFVEQEDPNLDDDDQSFLEQDDSLDLDIDFESEADDTEIEEDNEILDQDPLLSDIDYEKRQSDRINIDLEEIAAAGSEEASATIQEMIGFRQVMKAKYDIPESDLIDEEESLAETLDSEDPFQSTTTLENEEDDLDLLADTEVQGDEEEDLDLLADNEALSEDEEDLDLLADAEAQIEEEGDLTLFADDDMDQDSAFSEAELSENAILEIDSEFDDDDKEDDLEDIDLLSEDEGDTDHITPQEPEKTAEDDYLLSEDLDEETEALSEPDEIMELIEEDEDEDFFEDVALADDITEDEDDDVFVDADLEPETSLLEDEDDEPFEEIDLLHESAESEELSIEDDSDDLFMDGDENSEEEEPFEILDIESPSEVLSLDSKTEEDLPNLIDEDEEEEEIEMHVETESDVDDIDFLPVDEEEALDEGGADDVFQPLMSDALSAESEGEIEEITIEVPQETFEMGDFNVRDISDEEPEEPLQEITDEESDLMKGIETVKVDQDSLTEDEDSLESFEDSDLPSMDDDLPELSPILDTEDDFEDDSLLESPDESSEKDSDIQLMQVDEDFEDFPGEDDVITISEDQPTASPSPAEAVMEELPSSLSPEFRSKLTAMIEGVITETVQSTLHEKLPEMVEKLMSEELED